MYLCNLRLSLHTLAVAAAYLLLATALEATVCAVSV